MGVYLWVGVTMNDLIPQIALQQDEDATPIPFRFLALVQESDKPNQNRRVFPRKVLEQQIERLQEDVRNRSLLGELGVPIDTIIHFDKASHVILDLYMSGNNLMAEIEVLDTPAGQQLRSLLGAGVPIGFRMSGVGSGDNIDGNFVVNETYKLIQIFACNNPA